ncbi:NeuD/PglB/VioB family sugar acetyltransferase [Calditrichota bacterium]
MSSNKPIVVMGGLGSGLIATSVIEDINSVEQSWEILGFLNDFIPVGSTIGAYPVVGATDEASEYADRGNFLHYAMRNAKHAKSRIRRLESMNLPVESFATLIHPSAHISRYKGIGNGSLLYAGVTLSDGVRIGNHNHLYGNSYVAHDTVIEDYAWICAGAVVGSSCEIGEGAHIGLNATVIENVKIGKYALVGAGAVVIKDVEDGAVVVGNPAKMIGHVDDYKGDPSDPTLLKYNDDNSTT